MKKLVLFVVFFQLSEKLASLNEERKKNLKDLIIQRRILLDELWSRCVQFLMYRPFF